ncbi:HAMP domain-containing sensor histidine kinase [Saccharothrix sp.]|uniref:HAMP domain-containing sensor histidine kinase n=1 Tax=Saccharothrix sp. TaxID=1873460 RepID=UPI002810EE93|nr:HAMP domain-containing sensor histidine kinase [Saccharothrix sp.]
MKLRTAFSAFVDFLPRPLDPVRSIKLKLGILLVSSGAAGFSFFWYRIGWLPYSTTTGALVIALVTSQVLAHGMTRPLREMTAAARAMRRGDYSKRVRATARDEVGELASAFNQMAADLAAADRQRRELIANVSHELRTPITALQNVLENVVDGVAAPDARTMRTALAQTERLGRLVTELLDLSRIDAGAHRLTLAEFPVAPLLADVVAEASVASPATRFVVDVRPPTATVVADRARVHQVLVNLLDNAARHGPSGGEVRVTATWVARDLVLEVSDDGPGIAPEDRERVFERFTRGERAGGGGTGLGLNIARWIIDLHGGSIAVVDGPGCRIRATLPSIRTATTA